MVVEILKTVFEFVLAILNAVNSVFRGEAIMCETEVHSAEAIYG